MKQYYIHGEPVTPREIWLTAPEGYDYTSNVLTFEGKEYDLHFNGVGDAWITVNGKKRYLEEAEETIK